MSVWFNLATNSQTREYFKCTKSGPGGKLRNYDRGTTQQSSRLEILLVDSISYAAKTAPTSISGKLRPTSSGFLLLLAISDFYKREIVLKSYQLWQLAKYDQIIIIIQPVQHSF